MELEAERLLVERAKNDPQVFGVIFDKYYPKVLAYTIRRTNDVFVAEEIVSTTFIKAFNGLKRFRWQGISIEAWLFRIAVNELRMHYRKKHRTVSLEELCDQYGFEPPSERDVAQEAQEAQEKLARHEQFARAQQLINNLPAKYRDVLVLRFAEGKKVSEIAQIINKKEGTVKSLLSRGLERLRKELLKETVQPTKQGRIIKTKGGNQYAAG